METLLMHGPTILLFIVVLAVLVIVHELGHYLAARFFGIDVEEFGIGYPPRAWSIRRGKTVWSLNWIPIGGFVRIRGEDDPSAEGSGTFASKPAGVRAIVLGAGVFMNLALASLLFAVGLMVGLPQATEGLPSSARVRDARVQVVEVLPGSPASEAGFAAGDVIVSVGGEATATVDAVQSRVNAAGEKVEVQVRRGRETLVKELSPKADKASGRKVMGVALVETAIVSYPWYQAVPKGIQATGFYAKEIVVSLGGLIKGLFVGQKPGVEFSGPVGIAVLTGQAARLGFAYLIQFAALLSVNLAVINILPIPALDGGRLLFVIIEKFRGRGVRPIVEAVTHRIAYFLLLGLVLFVTLKDLARYREQIFGALKGLFGMA